MKSDLDFTNYLSPFSWRYGSEEMREIFSEVNKRKTWRRVWVAIAKAQTKLNLITKEELKEIEKQQNNIDIKRAHEEEKEIKHDLMAELKTFAAQIGKAGGKLHLGATSQDIEDNADIVNFTKAIAKVEKDLKQLLLEFAKKIEENKDLVCMAYTHLQPAEPTTLGYRFAMYAQDLLTDLELLEHVKKNIKGKGTKGSVGTYASYFHLLGEKAKNLEDDVLGDLGINAFDVTGQVYPRKQDYIITVVLASIAQSLYKFAFDFRIMQSLPFGEWMEPFSAKQVGSSAMPFKRNPQTAEKICSLARHVVSLNRTTWDNAANSLLERTLDDSAARRIAIPEAFLATDEIISQTQKILEGMTINSKSIEQNLERYGPFSALEAILMESTKSGANRQDMHEILRTHAMKAFEEIADSKPNPLAANLKEDKKITKYISGENIEKLMDYRLHIGLAPKKASYMAIKIQVKMK